MPKREIDYSNTIIYKIICKDQNIKDIYVGHTTNFIQRKHAHKQSCINEKSKNYKCKLYDIIRNNGGWNNWNMVIVDFFNCINGNDARKKEQEYYEKLNANLNSIEPFKIKELTHDIIKPIIEKKIYYCDKCDITTNTQKQLDKHFRTLKHKYIVNLAMNIVSQKSQLKYTCEYCDYNTDNKYDYNKHLQTRKHKNTIKYNKLSLIDDKNLIFTCDCGKTYPYRASLYNHKKKCKINEEEKEKTTENIKIDKEDDIDYKKLLLEFIKDNKELQKMLIDVLPKMNSITNNTVNNNNNNNININIFLNEQCKDAMTMNDFVNNLTVSLDDLVITKEKGICQGVINIMTKNLKELSVYERPMHCTDTKRETVYIKSSGDIIGGKEEPAKWGKDQHNRLLKQVIDKASHIQRMNLKLWTEEHPNWETNSEEQIEYMTLIKNSMADIKEKKNENKVIKKLCDMTKGRESLKP